MGEEVVPSYMRSKLSSILKEAEADSVILSHIKPRLRSIQTRIESMVMIIPVDLLYELIELVSECRLFSFERRTAALSKKGFGFYFLKLLHHPPLSKLMFNRRMRRRLDSIHGKIEDCTASQEPSQPPIPIIEETRPIEDTSLIIGFDVEADTIVEIENIIFLSPKQQPCSSSYTCTRTVHDTAWGCLQLISSC